MRSAMTVGALAAGGAAAVLAGMAWATGAAHADGGAPRTAPRIPVVAAESRDLHLTIDTAAPVRLSADAAGVVIGNPSVAGVSVQNNRLLFVTGRAYGSTSLTVVDDAGAVIYHGRVTVVPDETGAVMVIRGADVSRLACNPECRPSPDIGDSSISFERALGQANARSGQARSAE